MNYSRKYLYNYGIFILAAASLFFFFGINRYLAKQKNKIEQNFSRQFNKKILIGSLKYFPPNYIILGDVSIGEYASSKSALLSSAKKIELTFSLNNLLIKKAFIITGLSLIKPEIHFPDIPEINLIEYFFSVFADIKQFVVILSPLIDQKISKFNVKEGSFIFPNSARPLTTIGINSFEINKKGLISSRGSIGFEAFSFDSAAPQNNNPNRIDYAFKGRFGERGVVIEGLKFKKTNFYAKFWGALNNDVAGLKGFAFFGDFSDYLASGEKQSQNIISKLKNIAPHPRDSGVIWLSSFGNLNIYNFDCSVKFGVPDIRIDNLSFYLNNTPVFLKGDISFLEKTSVDLKLSFYRNSFSSNGLDDGDKFDAELKGKLGKGKFSGKISFDYPKEIHNRILRERIQTDFKNLTLILTRDKHIKISFKDADFYYTSSGNPRRFILNKFNALCVYKDKNLKFVSAALLSDGIIKAKGTIDAGDIPFKRYLDLNIRKISIDALVPFLGYLSSFSGRLDSRMFIRNWPELNLKGEAAINKGAVENLKFLGWFEHFFGSQKFKKVDFENLSMNFLINDKISNFKAIKLEGEKLKLHGNFSLYEGGLVSGKFFMSLSQDLLKDSEKFKPLLRILGQDMPFIDFDFQLSGLSNSMNFKWLESNFKNRLRNSLPGFIERGIEKKVEGAINSISKQN